MSPDRQDRGPEEDEYDDAEYADEAPRSVFATTWFRAVAVVVVLGAAGILGLPYLLDWVDTSKLSPTVKGPTLSVPSPPRPVTPATGGLPEPGGMPPATAGPATSGRETAEPPSATLPAPAREARPESTVPGSAARATVQSATRADSVSRSSEAVTPETVKSAADSPRTTARRSQAEAGRTPRKLAEAPAAEKPRSPRAAQSAPAKARKGAPAVSTPGGPYWVQVGAYRDRALATALATKLRAENFPVVEVAPAGGGGESATAEAPPPAAPSPGDKYDVFVAGASPAEVNEKLSGKGLSSDPVAGGAVVKPSLPLRDAVSLSKDLAMEGLKVQVRRAAVGPAVERPAARATTPAGGDGFHRVRVGGFPDRAAAEDARKALAAKGYSAFIGKRGG